MTIETCSVKKKTVMGKSSANQASIIQCLHFKLICLLVQNWHKIIFMARSYRHTRAYIEVEINLYGQKLSEMSIGRQQDLSISNFMKVGMIKEVDDKDSEDSDILPKIFFRRRLTENTRHLEHTFKRAFS